MEKIYNIIFLKTEWTEEKTKELLQERKIEFKELEETDEVYSYTINYKESIEEQSVLFPLTDSLFLHTRKDENYSIEDAESEAGDAVLGVEELKLEDDDDESSINTDDIERVSP
jgi:hypothetical protein